MNFNEVLQNIRDWNAVRDNAASLKAAFAGRKFFSFSYQLPQNWQGQYLHFYPALDNGKPLFYMINSGKDSQAVYDSDPAGFVNNITAAYLPQKNGRLTR